MRKLLTSPWTLLAVIALLRSPGFAFGVLNIDESDYLVYGAGILKGLLPYRDLVEIKPPLGYLTYTLAGGLNLWPIRILGVLWVFCTALLLRGAARRWTGSEEAGWAAAWMSLLAGLVEVPAFGGEVMMNLPVAASIYFFARSRRAGGLLLCGICVGLATLYRHHAVIAAVAFAVALLVRPADGWRRALAGVAALAAGGIVPWVAVAAGYAALGQLRALPRSLRAGTASRRGCVVSRSPGSPCRSRSGWRSRGVAASRARTRSRSRGHARWRNGCDRIPRRAMPCSSGATIRRSTRCRIAFPAHATSTRRRTWATSIRRICRPVSIRRSTGRAPTSRRHSRTSRSAGRRGSSTLRRRASISGTGFHSRRSPSSPDTARNITSRWLARAVRRSTAGATSRPRRRAASAEARVRRSGQRTATTRGAPASRSARTDTRPAAARGCTRRCRLVAACRSASSPG